jgi:hypothetical protein
MELTICICCEADLAVKPKLAFMAIKSYASLISDQQRSKLITATNGFSISVRHV